MWSKLIFRYPAGNYMLKVNNTNTRARFEVSSKLTVKTPERRRAPESLFLFLIKLQALNIIYNLF